MESISQIFTIHQPDINDDHTVIEYLKLLDLHKGKILFSAVNIGHNPYKNSEIEKM